MHYYFPVTAEASLSFQEDRDEGFKTENTISVNPIQKVEIWRKKKRESSDSLPTLGERAKQRKGI